MVFWPPDTWISTVAWLPGLRMPVLGLTLYFSGEVVLILYPTILVEMLWIWILEARSPAAVVENKTWNRRVRLTNHKTA